MTCVTINFNVVMSVTIKFINKLLHYVYRLMSLIKTYISVGHKRYFYG